MLPAVCTINASFRLPATIAGRSSAKAESLSEMIYNFAYGFTSSRLVVYSASTFCASSRADSSVRLYTCTIRKPFRYKAFARLVARFPAPINTIGVSSILLFIVLKSNTIYLRLSIKPRAAGNRTSNQAVRQSSRYSVPATILVAPGRRICPV